MGECPYYTLVLPLFQSLDVCVASCHYWGWQLMRFQEEIA